MNQISTTQDRVIRIDGGASTGIPLDFIQKQIIRVTEGAPCEYGPEAKNRLIIGFIPGIFCLQNIFKDCVEDMKDSRFLASCMLGQSSFSEVVLMLPKVFSPLGEVHVIANTQMLDEIRHQQQTDEPKKEHTE